MHSSVNHVRLAYLLLIFYIPSQAHIQGGGEPYVDIQGLPELSFHEPGDIIIAYIAGLSGPGINSELCADVLPGAFRYAEAARSVIAHPCVAHRVVLVYIQVLPTVLGSYPSRCRTHAVGFMPILVPHTVLCFCKSCIYELLNC